MRQALHEYRDEASRRVRAYRTLARSEGWFHKRLRSQDPDPLRLPGDVLDELATWREREVPVTPVPDQAAPVARVENDPTQQDDAADIRPLERSGGITWREAAGG
jgi:hypothetical protein